MMPLLERKVIVVAGKGGVGKTTVAGALGLLAARNGRRTIVVEVGQRQHLPALLGLAQSPRAGEEVKVAERLTSLSIDPDHVLAEWLKALGGRVSTRVLLSSSTFQYFVAATPGAREMLSMVKVWGLTGAGGTKYDRARDGDGRHHELVILDAPATGHALAMLAAPRTFAGLARMGPIARQSEEVDGLLHDAQRCAYIAVAHGSEMAVSETLQLQAGLHEALGRELDAVVFNAALPRRFEESELQRIAGVRSEDPAARAAAAAALAVHERARLQNNQLARLRRRKLPVVRVPFVFQAQLDKHALERIADRLERGLVSR